MEFESSWISHNEENRVHNQLNNFKVEDGSRHDPNEAPLQDDTCYICLLFNMPRRRRTVNAASTWIRVTPEGARTSHFVHVRFCSCSVPLRAVCALDALVPPGSFNVIMYTQADSFGCLVLAMPSSSSSDVRPTIPSFIKMAMKIYGELEVCVI